VKAFNLSQLNGENPTKALKIVSISLTEEEEAYLMKILCNI
jgi:hypothetical protein